MPLVLRELMCGSTRFNDLRRGVPRMSSSLLARRLRGKETIPGLTWPTMTFKGEMTLWMGKLEVKLLQLGRGHTKGDTVVWLPQERTLLSGDLVEFDATPYAGDAYFNDWPQTLANVAALKPLALVPAPKLVDLVKRSRASASVDEAQ